MGVSISFFNDALTPTSYVNMALEQKVLFSAYIYLKYAGNISNTVNFYSISDALSSSVHLPVSSVIILKKVNFSKMTFSESYPINYTIRLNFTIYQYTDSNEYEQNVRHASLNVLPILYGRTGVI